MSDGHPATIKDVAAHAGVSVATVSAVINENKYVSAELAQRVRSSIAALGYERNSLAQSLKKHASHTIGLIISDITNPFFTTLVRGAEDTAHAHGYTLILGNTDEDLVKEAAYLHLLRTKRADGLIVAVTAGSHEHLRAWPSQRLPLVCVDRSLVDLGLDAVLVDNVLGACQAVEHLIGLGHRRVGIITGLPGITSTDERLAGYRQALAAHGLPIETALIAEGNSRVEGGERAARCLLTSGSSRPTALFVTNGQMVIGALKALADLGLACPEEIAVVGFDDFEWAMVLRPRVTTLRQPSYEMGRRAVLLLLERLRGHGGKAREIRLPPELIVRESCGAQQRVPAATGVGTADPDAS